MGKRSNGEGTISRRADGRWMARLTVGRDDSGRLKRKSVYGMSQQEVRDKLQALREQHSKAPGVLIRNDTVAGFVAQWLADDVRINKSNRTHYDYQYLLNKHALPFLGTVKLASLNAEMLRAWQGKLARRGSSADQRKRCLTILTTALNCAASQGLIHFNPCLNVTKPKVERPEIYPLEPDQQAAVIAAAAEVRLGEIVTVAIHTGLRKGELLGLQWSSVHFAEGALHVRHSLEEVSGKHQLKSPKSKAGRRMVPLTAQATAALRNRLDAAIAEGMPPEEVSTVFPDTRGGFMRGSNFDRRFWRPVKTAARLPDSVRFHDLRHTFASTSLEAGVRMEVLQKLMGHSSYQTTADVYGHLMQGARCDAISLLAQYHERHSMQTV